jgi:putative endonuclease
MVKEKPHCYLYMLFTGSGTLYTGYTTDIIRRWHEHLGKKAGAKYTRVNRPRSIASCWLILGAKSTAMKLEASLKKRTRKQKDEIVKQPGTLLNRTAIAGFDNSERVIPLPESLVRTIQDCDSYQRESDCEKLLEFIKCEKKKS